MQNIVGVVGNGAVVVLVFAGLIFFHELGHFLAARSFGMGVKTFSLGFGPALFRRAWGKTTYQISCIPLGGYVALVGEQNNAEIPAPFTEKDSFALRPAWQRFIVIFAGAFFNILLAWILCWGVFWHQGERVPTTNIEAFVPESPAAHSSLALGDMIVAVNDAPVTTWMDVIQGIQHSRESEITMTVEREGHGRMTVSLTPEVEIIPNLDGTETSVRRVGIRPGTVKTRDYGILESAGLGFNRTLSFGGLIYYSLKGLVTAVVPASSMAGALGIVQIIYEQSEQGVIPLLFFAALISVNLGILNLLPIPVLDGGHLLFIGVEMIARKPIPMEIQEKAMLFGLFFLICLMLFATYNDVVRLVQ